MESNPTAIANYFARDVITMPRDASVFDAATLMRKHHVGAFVIVAMGMFGLGEIVRNLENERTRSVVVTEIKNLMPTRDDLKRIWAPILRGTALGSMLGILPGSGSILGSFASYSLEKKLAKDPSRFGKGAIEGVAGPESANSAGAQTISTFT